MTTEKSLDDWATQAFQNLRRHINGNAYELSTDVAATVGRHANRIKMSKEDLIKWFQGAYGRIWVRLSNLNPGLDAKDVLKVLLKGYK